MDDWSDDAPRRGGDQLPHDWEASYAATPPWDIGRPQDPFARLAEAGHLHGSVLDVGCGTGEHALLAAEYGCEATGVDVAPTAIQQARDKARDRALEARFLVHDVLQVDELRGRFDVVLDCGFFHVLADADRARFTDVLREVMAAEGTYHMLCFSERVPGDAGPRRIRQDEIRSTFSDGLTVEAIDESSIEATFLDEPVPAWLAHIVRQP